MLLLKTDGTTGRTTGQFQRRRSGWAPGRVAFEVVPSTLIAVQWTPTRRNGGWRAFRLPVRQAIHRRSLFF